MENGIRYKQMCVALLSLSMPVIALAGGNYVVSRTMLNALGTYHIDKVDYFDGLGRCVSTVLRGVSPDGGNVVTMREYDGLSRQVMEWQPVPFGADSSEPITPCEFGAASSHYYSDNRAFTETEYECAPTDYISSVSRPGEILAGRAVIMEKFVNDQTKEFSCFKLKVGADGSLRNVGKYAKGSLLATKTTDEDGNTAIVFTDSRGLSVMHRHAIKAGEYADTYHVYDNYGDLRYIIPPMAADEVTRSTSREWNRGDRLVDDYCYYYEYNTIGLVTLKKLPGREKIVYGYDSHNQHVLSQDGAHRETGTWRFQFRDRYGRIVVEGNVGLSAAEAEALLSECHVAGFAGEEFMSTYGYRIDGNTDVPDASFKADIAYYYDDYSFLGMLPIGDSTQYFYEENKIKGNSRRHTSAVGRLTGTMVSGNLTVYYYDLMGNVVQQHSRNRVGSYDRMQANYDFAGNPKTVTYCHSSKWGSITECYRHVYDSSGRLTATYHRLDNGEEKPLLRIDYDLLCRPSFEHLGGVIPVSSAYDVQGRRVGIGSEAFTQTLVYESSGSLNGNVASERWTNGGVTEGYAYEYDGIGRLVKADFTPEGAGSRDVEYRYDKHGNPVRILRKGAYFRNGVHGGDGKIDDLRLEYRGNQLDFVYESAEHTDHEGATDYSTSEDASRYGWDSNGNMESDPSRGIKKIYYKMDKPEMVDFSNGSRISYGYDALGRKYSALYEISNMSVSRPGLDIGSLDSLMQTPAKKSDTEMQNIANHGIAVDTQNSINRPPLLVDSMIVDTGTQLRFYHTLMEVDYSGRYEYRNGKLWRILTPTGYIDSGGDYFHYVKDNRGSIRAVVDQEGKVVERNDYYPYGMLVQGKSVECQPNKYEGKEFERLFGMNEYDFGARRYTPSTLLFTTPDPLSEKYPSVSPYAYCASNPIRYTDPTGKEIKVDPMDITFSQKYAKVRNYLKEHGLYREAQKVADDPNVVIYVKNATRTGGKNLFKPNEMTLYLDLNNAVEFDNGNSVSPAVVLEHEFSHVFQRIYNKSEYGEYVDMEDSEYKNKEERRVIEGAERKAAEKLGEIPVGGKTRTNYNIKGLIPVDDPTKNKKDDNDL